MNRLKSLFLTAMSCCVMFSACGRAAPDNESGVTPFNVENIETTEPSTFDEPEDMYDEPVTTRSSVSTTYIPFSIPVTTTVTAYVAHRSQVTTIPAKAPDSASANKTSSSVTTSTSSDIVTVTVYVSGSTNQVTATSPPEIVPIVSIPSQNPNGNESTSTGTSSSTSTTTAAPAITSSTTTTLPAVTPERVLASMSLKQKVCQLFIVAPEQLTGPKAVLEAGVSMQDAIADYPVGGILLSDQNFSSREQTVKLINTLQNYSKHSCGVGMFTAISEEGSTYSAALGITEFEDMAVYGKNNDTREAFDIGKTMGDELKSLGFNLDLAPVADVAISANNPLGDRIFSSDPEVVANMVSNMVLGMQDSGIKAVVKHFPGLGAVDGSSKQSDGSIILNRGIDALRNEEFKPFKSAINVGVSFILVGHQKVTGYGDDLPADLSEIAVTEMLRGELDFDGVCITDSHSLPAITKNYDPGEAAVLAINAGMDIILLPEDLQEAVDAVCDAVYRGEISKARLNESVLRVLREKESLGLI